METRTIALSSLLALAAAGNVYFVWQGTTYRAAVEQPSSSVVELTGSAKAPFVAAAVEAGAAGSIECKRDAIANRPGAVYCTDGKTAGWLVPLAVASALLTEAKSKIPSLTVDEVRTLIDQDGKLWASKVGD